MRMFQSLLKMNAFDVRPDEVWPPHRKLGQIKECRVFKWLPDIEHVSIILTTTNDIRLLR